MTKADVVPEQQPVDVTPDDAPRDETSAEIDGVAHDQAADEDRQPALAFEGEAEPALKDRGVDRGYTRLVLARAGGVQEPSEAGTSASGNTIYLSLFLILLTFFIGLTSNAQFDMARVGMVFDSVAASFGAHGQADREPGRGQRIGGLVWFSDDYATAADPAFVRAFRSAFTPLIPEGAALVENSDGRVFVDVPQSALFVEGTWAVRQSRIGLLEALGRLLVPSGSSSGGDGRRIAISAPADRRGGSSVRGELDLRRAAALARWMVRSGAHADHLSTGVDGRSLDLVRFEIFRARGGIS